ncbi:hypothetical protein [Photobacterium damselae]|uniref:hypothetical protein n=1 Tax=Photobacterium damselae TaxID=38293 RepID=UPI001F1D7F3D|nr:hypothetical protein [Photobacterium damselae]UKA05056.1 hypothetical protein IHC89_22680 [Photobacterium damselae subsp. damselae]
MNDFEMTPEREKLMEKLDDTLEDSDSVATIIDGDGVFLDSLSNDELKFMLEQHEENKKILAKREQK